MSSSSDSDFESFSGNAKRISGRPKIRPAAASTPATAEKTSAARPVPEPTLVKRRPGRPPKKLTAPTVTPSLVVAPAPASRVKEPRLSLVDGGSSTDNDASMAISAAINRVFDSGASDSEHTASGRKAGKSLSVSGAKGGGKAAVLSPIQYTSSLLRDFVEKTQKLGQQQEANVIVPDQTANSLPRESSATNWDAAPAKPEAAGTGEVVKRKRGRPPKKPPVPQMPESAAVVAQGKTDRLTSRVKLAMRDSPDSGILSVNQSPSHSPRLVKRANTVSASAGRSQATSSSSNAMLLSLEKPMYTTERVLYPPRNIKRGRPPLNKAKESAARMDKTGVDPIWRKIDINKKFQRPTNGYKSDGGSVAGERNTVPGTSDGALRGEGSSVVCSKVLAAQCGYASDYGSVRKSRQSGYRSDYSTKSRKSGYRSDYSTKGGCGYRSDCSVRRKLRRKRRPKSTSAGSGGAKNLLENNSGSLPIDPYLGVRVKSAAFDEEDILQLAGLSLGNSSDDESGNEVTVVTKPSPEPKIQKSEWSFNVLMDNFTHGLLSLAGKEWLGSLKRQVNKFGMIPSHFADFDRAKFEREFIANYRSLVAQSRAEAEAMEARLNPPEDPKAKNKKGERKPEVPKYNHFESFSNVLPIIELKSKRSAKSIRSRRSSAVSRCSSRSNRSMHHKHRRKRLKSKSESGPQNKLAEKIRLQLEQIIEIFGPACQLIDLPVKSLKNQQVQIPEPGTTASEANKKEKETPKASQKRGVKKRKFSENADPAGTPTGPKRRTKKGQESQSPDDHKLPLKKRHYLLSDGEKGSGVEHKESQEEEEEKGLEHGGDSKGPGTPKVKSLDAPQSSSSDVLSAAHTPRSRKQVELQPQDKKKKLLSPSTPSGRGRPPKFTNSPSTGEKKLSPVPPPGVFEPTVDLELQIPISTIVISSTGKSGLLTVRSKLEKSLDSPSLKKKRKKINRTGFPTLKKKKKRMTPVPVALTVGADILPDLKLEKCDRVPEDGETASIFMERDDLQQKQAVVSVERLPELELPPTRTLRTKLSPAVLEKSQDVPVPSPRASRKVKLEEPKVEESLEAQKPKRRCNVKVDPPAPVQSKTRSRRANSAERSEDSGKPERRISLLEEISPNKRQSIRNLAKTLMESEVAAQKDVVDPPVPAKKIDPRKRRMTVAVLEPSKVRTPPPLRLPPPRKSVTPIPPLPDQSPTALKDIKPAPTTIEMEQDVLPMPEEDHDDVESIARTDTPSSEVSDRSSTKKVPKWKKKYLPAGLFSEYYKEPEKDRSKKDSAKDSGEPSVCPALLPPPPYCENFYRRSQVDFQLPHDLWWAHDNQKLPGRDTVASWTFKKIRTNVYSDVKPNPNTDLPSCNCKPSSGCVDDCLNRMVYTECNPDTCPCEEKCQNTKIQRHEFAPGIERFMTEKKGWGVRTKYAIKKSQFIIEYLGEVVTEREFKERMGNVYAKDTHHYCLHLDGDLVIDGHRMGSDCRFVNHSCTPNCEMQKWSVNGLSRMSLFALRDIKPGEELTYDYNFALYNPSEGQPCKCDSKDCRGVIGGKSQRVTKPVAEAAVSEDKKSGRNRKRQAKKNQSQHSSKVRPSTPLFQVPTNKEISIIRESNCFLMRNLMKVS